MKKILDSVMAISMAMMAMALNAQEVLIMSCELDEKQQMVVEQLMNVDEDRDLNSLIEWHNATKNVINEVYGANNTDVAFADVMKIAQSEQEVCSGSNTQGYGIEMRLCDYRNIDAYLNLMRIEDVKLRGALTAEMEAWLKLEEMIFSLNANLTYSCNGGTIYAMCLAVQNNELAQLRSKLYGEEAVNIIAKSKYLSDNNVANAVTEYSTSIEDFISLCEVDEEDVAKINLFNEGKVEFEQVKILLHKWVKTRSDVAKLLGSDFGIYSSNTERIIMELPMPIPNE